MTSKDDCCCDNMLENPIFKIYLGNPFGVETFSVYISPTEVLLLRTLPEFDLGLASYQRSSLM